MVSTPTLASNLSNAVELLAVTIAVTLLTVWPVRSSTHLREGRSTRVELRRTSRSKTHAAATVRVSRSRVRRALESKIRMLRTISERTALATAIGHSNDRVAGRVGFEWVSGGMGRIGDVGF